MKSLPADAKVLFVGVEPPAEECLQRLVKAGAKHFTILYDKSLDGQLLSENAWLSSTSIGKPVAQVIAAWLSERDPGLVVDALVEDPLVVAEKNPDFILSFSLVITMGVARDIELALGKILYEAPPRVLLISRSDEFHGKMRSQYRVYTDSEDASQAVIEGIDLTLRPEPPTAEKCERVRKALTSWVDVSSPEILSFLVLVYATGQVFKATQGYPPAHRPAAVSLTGHENEVEALIRKVIAEKDLRQATVDTEAIRICCAKGWGALPPTALVMGALIAGEATTLLTNVGKPVNCVPLDLGAASALGIAVPM